MFIILDFIEHYIFDIYPKPRYPFIGDIFMRLIKFGAICVTQMIVNMIARRWNLNGYGYTTFFLQRRTSSRLGERSKVPPLFLSQSAYILYNGEEKKRKK
jgi:hypothetical protein